MPAKKLIDTEIVVCMEALSWHVSKYLVQLIFSVIVSQFWLFSLDFNILTPLSWDNKAGSPIIIGKVS